MKQEWEQKEQAIIEAVFAENPGGLTMLELYDKLSLMGIPFNEYPQDSVMNMLYTEGRRARGILPLDDDPIVLIIASCKRLLEKLQKSSDKRKNNVQN